MQRALPEQTISSIAPATPRAWLLSRRTLWIVFFAALLVGSVLQSGLFRQDVVNAGGWNQVLRFFEASLRPELSREFLGLVLDATVATLAFASCGAFFSTLIGFGAGILASEVWWQSLLPKSNQRRWRVGYRAPWLLVRTALAAFRAIHEIVWGLFFVTFIGLDPLVAILAIAIPFGAITAKVFSEILDEAPRGPLIALQNSGVSPHKAFIYTLLPQAMRGLVSYGFYRFECAIRAAAVLGIIGAGGLGYEIFLSLQTLKFQQIWTLFLALFLLNGLVDFWSALLRRRMQSSASRGAGERVEMNAIEQPVHQRTDRQQDWVVKVSLFAGVLLVPLSFWYVDPDFGRLFSSRTIAHFGNIVRSAFPPDFSALSPSEWLRLSMVTFSMSLLAIAGAGPFAFLLSFPAASNFLLPGGLMDSGGSGRVRRARGVVLLFATRALLLVARSVPPPIWALILMFVLFPGIVPGAAALGLYTLGVLGRLLAEVTENLDDRPLIALRAQGAASGQVFAYGVLPPLVPTTVGFLLYRWEEAIRATVVIGLVGAGGLGRLLTEQLSSFDYQGVLTTLIIFAGLTLLVDQISAAARRAFREP